jgi:hypothetical protein
VTTTPRSDPFDARTTKIDCPIKEKRHFGRRTRPHHTKRRWFRAFPPLFFSRTAP